MRMKRDWASPIALLHYASGTLYYLCHLSLLVAGGAGAVASFVSLRFEKPILASILVIASGVTVLLAIRSRAQVTKARNEGSNPSLRIESVEVVYTMLDVANYDYSRHIRATAVLPVDHYKDKFHWTGDGQIVVVPLSGIARIEVASLPDTLMRECRAVFPRHLAKGGYHEFSYIMQLRGARTVTKPFFAVSVGVAVRRLRIKVRFPSGYRIKCYRLQIFRGQHADVPVWERVVDCSNLLRCEAQWQVHAVYGYLYRVHWDPVVDHQ
jgi:hypothetical protein